MACFGWYIDEEICEKLRTTRSSPQDLIDALGKWPTV
jgi:hypothetical protein